MYLAVATGNSTVGHSVADIIQNAAGRTHSKELVAVSNNQLMKRTPIVKPTWHAPWKLMRVSSQSHRVLSLTYSISSSMKRSYQICKHAQSFLCRHLILHVQAITYCLAM